MTNPTSHRIPSAWGNGKQSAPNNPWLNFAHHISALFEKERSGALIRAHQSHIEYMRLFHREMHRCQNIPTLGRRRDRLLKESDRFRRRASWRAKFPELADNCAHTLAALAGDVKMRCAGNSDCYLGETRFIERRYVNRAFKELDSLALSQLRLDWMKELRLGSRANRPSRGRALVARYAMKLAEADGEKLDRREISKHVREYIKTAPPPLFNALGDQSPRKRQRPKRRLIKAAGT